MAAGKEAKRRTRDGGSGNRRRRAEAAAGGGGGDGGGGADGYGSRGGGGGGGAATAPAPREDGMHRHADDKGDDGDRGVGQLSSRRLGGGRVVGHAHGPTSAAALALKKENVCVLFRPWLWTLPKGSIFTSRIRHPPVCVCVCRLVCVVVVSYQEYSLTLIHRLPVTSKHTKGFLSVF